MMEAGRMPVQMPGHVGLDMVEPGAGGGMCGHIEHVTRVIKCTCGHGHALTCLRGCKHVDLGVPRHLGYVWTLQGGGGRP